MFDLSTKRQVWILVEWPGLVQEGGEKLAVATTHEIEMLVELLDKEEAAQLSDRYKEVAPADPDNITPAERAQGLAMELAAIKEIASDWRKVLSGGQPVPFTDENIMRMIKVQGFSPAFNLAYRKAQAGMAETREKNSEGSPASGQAAE